MNIEVQFRPDLSTPEPSVVVFGRDAAGKPHASWFDADTAPLALKAAALMGMQVLTIATAEQRQLVERFARGRVFASGRAFTPFVREKAFAELLKMAGAATEPTAASGQNPAGSAPDRASTPSNEAEASPTNEPTTTTAETQPKSAAGQPPEGGGTDAAGIGVPRPRTWDEIGIGSLVLALEGPDEGWWPSLVVGVRDEFFSLKWHGFPKLPMFTRRRTELALLPPSY